MASNGLIDEYAAVAGAKVPQVSSKGYTAAATTAAQTAPSKAAAFTPAEATTAEVAGNQLVQNQIRGIIDENSPLQLPRSRSPRGAA
jgi:hypothetical protein